jgi:hypothetical protein
MMSRLVDSEGKLLSNSTPPQHPNLSLVAVCLLATASPSLHTASIIGACIPRVRSIDSVAAFRGRTCPPSSCRMAQISRGGRPFAMLPDQAPEFPRQELRHDISLRSARRR